MDREQKKIGTVSKQTVLFREKERKMEKRPSRGMNRRAFLKASGAIGLGTITTVGTAGDLSAQSGLRVGEKSPGEMIDLYPHILPAKYNKALLKKAKPCYYLEANRISPPLANLEERLRFMDKSRGFAKY